MQQQLRTEVPDVFEKNTMEQLCAAYLKCRDMKAAIQGAADAKIEPVQDAMNRMTRVMGNKLEAAGAKSMRTERGTVYSTVKRYTNITAWDLFHEWLWVNKRFDLLQRRVNNPGIIAAIEETGEIPPGCHIVSEVEIQVRKT